MLCMDGIVCFSLKTMCGHRAAFHSLLSLVSCCPAHLPMCTLVGAQIANGVMREAGVPLVETWNETLPLWEFHRDNGAGLECTHYCFPSAPQLWTYILFNTLRRLASTEAGAAAQA